MPPFFLLRLYLGFAKKCAKIYNAWKAMVPLHKVPAVVMYKKSHCRHISVVFTSIFTIQTSKSLKYSKELKYGLSSPTLVQSTRKIQFHSTQKIFGNSHRNIWSNGKRPRKRFNVFLMSLRSCRYVAIMSLSEDVPTATSFLRR